MKTYEWVPWRRYCLLLEISDGGGASQCLFLSRCRLKRSAEKEADRLSAYCGYTPIVIDTKTGQVLRG